MSRMPAIFVGHGSPMIALEDSEITRKMTSIGKEVMSKHGQPKGILAISAHWYVGDTFTQDQEEPKQIYDMYGFPDELYQVKYPAKGSGALSLRVQELLGEGVSVNNEWGIDHGSWTALIHLFPEADIPVVQLSVNRRIDARASYEIGEKLAALRGEGYLILGSGNLVHNLRRVEWSNEGGTEAAMAFNDYMVTAIEAREDEKVISYQDAPYASYAVPMPDHYLPLTYVLGASQTEKPYVFNNVGTLGSIAMTGFVFGL